MVPNQISHTFMYSNDYSNELAVGLRPLFQRIRSSQPEPIYSHWNSLSVTESNVFFRRVLLAVMTREKLHKYVTVCCACTNGTARPPSSWDPFIEPMWSICTNMGALICIHMHKYVQAWQFQISTYLFEIFKCPYEHNPCVKSAYTSISCHQISFPLPDPDFGVKILPYFIL